MPATRKALRTRSGIRAVVGGLAVSLVLGGCTGGDDDPPDRTPETTPTPSVTTPEPVELTFAASGTDEQVAAYRELAEAFERAEPGVSVEVTDYPDTPATLEALDAPGDKPTPDVFLLDSDYLTGLVAGEGEAVQPLDELLEEREVAFGDDHQRVALTELSAEASLQCMPAEMSPLVVYVNEDLLPSRRRLRSLGVVLPRATDPWTWSEFVATARAVAVSDGDGAVRGTYLPISTDLVTAFVRGAGDDLVDDVFEPTRVDLTSEEDLQVLSQLAVVAADTSVSLTPEQVERRSALDRFSAGSLGMAIGTRADVPALRESGVSFEVLPLPHFGRYRSVSSVTGYCISADSPAVEAAADFIAFAVSQPGATILAESGALVPARLDVASATAFTQPEQPPSNYRVYADAVRRSEPTPFAAEWPELSERVGRQLSRVLTDPTVDLGIELPRRMERLARRTEQVLAPEEVEEPTPSETDDAG